MKLFQKFAIGYLLFMAAGAWGVMVGKYEWFPYQVLQSISNFVRGYEGEDTSLWEKLMSDGANTPYRFIYHHPSIDKTAMTAMQIPGMRDRRAQPLMRLSKAAPRGYRAVFGAFDFEDAFWGAILIEPDGKVINTWHLSTGQMPGSTEPEYRKNMYGTAILPDGSIIFLMQEKGGGIVKVDYCSNILWTLDGLYHHVISLTDEGYFWTIEGKQTDLYHVLALVDAATGKVIRRINMKDVQTANPDISVFDLQREMNVSDAVHGNDIEALPGRLASDFPQFAKGDLLISFRTINLLFVLDPNTLRIKWWRIGPWDRQHDPDWNQGGYISVFSNNERKKQRGFVNHSDISGIDPQSLKSTILLKGADYDFYSSHNGVHEMTSEGTLLVTSAMQGRIFEVNRNKEIVFDFINMYDTVAGDALHVSNAQFLGPDFFEFDAPPKCEKK